jgi:hypothetical protein
MPKEEIGPIPKDEIDLAMARLKLVAETKKSYKAKKKPPS